MLRALSAGKSGDLSWLLAGRPFESPIGMRMLLPGLLQCRWGQRQRGWAFFGSFASAFLIGIWAWGSPLSWGCLALAFVTHTASVTDVLRQGTFPVYPARRATFLVSGALATLCPSVSRPPAPSTSPYTNAADARVGRLPASKRRWAGTDAKGVRNLFHGETGS